jgi:hypothetical protein
MVRLQELGVMGQERDALGDRERRSTGSLEQVVGRIRRDVPAGCTALDVDQEVRVPRGRTVAGIVTKSDAERG